MLNKPINQISSDNMARVKHLGECITSGFVIYISSCCQLLYRNTIKDLKNISSNTMPTIYTTPICFEEWNPWGEYIYGLSKSTTLRYAQHLISCHLVSWGRHALNRRRVFKIDHYLERDFFKVAHAVQFAAMFRPGRLYGKSFLWLLYGDIIYNHIANDDVWEQKNYLLPKYKGNNH